MMKKHKLLACVLICFAVLLALLLGGFYYQRTTYIRIGEETLRRDITELTLSGDHLPETALLQQLTRLTQLDARNIPLSISAYDTLREALPDCRILWKVPFQGAYLDEDTTELSVLSLSADDLRAIGYFPSLKTIRAEGCRDYDALMLLMEEYPQLEVGYCVVFQNREYDKNAHIITAENADTEELAAIIPYLPQLEEVVFEGATPTNTAIYGLMCAYPHIEFRWTLTVLGIETENTAEELILSGIPMEGVSQLEPFLKYFPYLQRVEMCDCGIASEDMDALSRRWPDIRFVWTVQIGRGTLRTDAVGFIPWKFGYSAGFPLYDKDCTELKYCTDMVCLDLGHMKISDLSFLEYMPKLKYLIVGELPCPDFSPITYCKELIYLEIFNTTFTNQEILLELPKLQDLNMGSTKVYGTEVLKQMTWLKRLWLAGTGLTFAEYDELVEALPDTQVVMHIPHSTAGGWRQHQNYYDMRDLLGMFYME